MFLPMELVEKCVGSRVWIVCRGNQEFTALLTGFDDYLNLVLEDATEYVKTPTGYDKTELESVLLNTKQIAMLVPGGEGPEAIPQETAEEEEAS